MSSFSRIIFVTILLCTWGFLSAQSASQVIDTKLPVLKNTPKTSGEFRSDLFTGSAAFSYVFDFPEGIGKWGPQLSLNYNSSNTDGFGTVGYGWSLSIPSISRYSKTGLQNLYTSDTFVAGGQELVLVDAEEDLYMSRDGSDMSQYFREDDGWRVVDDAGNTWIYGQTDNGRLSDPANDERVATWYLEEKTTLHDVTVRYTYLHGVSQVYIDTIEYVWEGNDPLYTIKFDYTQKTRSPESRRTGFPVKTDKLLSTVTLSVDGTDQKRYMLGYDSTQTVYSHLTSVAVSDLTTIYNTHTFTYLTGKDEHLLGSIDNGRGSVTELTYAPSTSYRNEDETLMNHSPFVTKTLSKITTRDLVADTTLEENLSYT